MKDEKHSLEISVSRIDRPGGKNGAIHPALQPQVGRRVNYEFISSPAPSPAQLFIHSSLSACA